MKTTEIGFRKTIVGWYNVVLIENGAEYNVSRELFLELTGASKQARAGRTEITGAQLVTMLTDRWTRRIPKPVSAVAV
ncbi:hypothetical protein [Sporosarcina obsidiansis]|uniref:hypothetical protein n=1 Tax=Sporosarcina obsidiansis TaxID=2660748 RepID=UPI00129B0802|nr:hypothetical protein [Sporosarcina obsidiansis]